jgi:hypothetical protein
MNKYQCKWNSNSSSKETCVGGFAGWTDSWSKYAYSRCCKPSGCTNRNVGLAHGCFNMNIRADFDKAKAFELKKGTKGLGKTYLEIATDACSIAAKQVKSTNSAPPGSSVFIR